MVASLLIADRLPVRPIRWTVDRSMRYIPPVAVAFRIDTFEPDREPHLAGRAGSGLRHVASVSNRDVAVHFDFHGVEVAHIVYFVFYPLQKGLSIIHQQRLPARGPSVPVSEGQIGSADAVDIGNVASHHGGLERSFK